MDKGYNINLLHLQVTKTGKLLTLVNFETLKPSIKRISIPAPPPLAY